MKLDLKIQAIGLRKQGKTYSEIQAEIGPVSKNSLSRWLRPIELTAKQKTRITEKSLTLGHIGRMKGSERNHEKRLERLARIHSGAKMNFPVLCKNSSFLPGLVLYLAEGSKKTERFEFMNSDPYLIALISQWITKFGGLEPSDIRYRLYIHKVYANEDCEKFWVEFLGLMPEQLLKTIYKPTLHKVKKNPSYKGCMRVELRGSELYWKVMTWQKCLYNSIDKSISPRGEMDITTVFGTVVGGSNPSAGTMGH